jgi:4-hydroxy-tetrahydrodipicolinate reductase
MESGSTLLCRSETGPEILKTKAMKIFLSGYGRMGKAVETAALKENHQIIGYADRQIDWETKKSTWLQADVVIDFSLPDVAYDNIRRCFNHHIPVVIGTTGWLKFLPQVRKQCDADNQSLFFAPNFNIGINLMMYVSRQLAGLLDNQPQYRLSVEETHHIHKMDAPSGTAIKIAEDIIAQINRYKQWKSGTAQSEGVLPVISHRKGEVIGTHSLEADSEFDTITLTHKAKSREGFANGAIKAAEFLQGKTGFYTMEQMLLNKF